MGPSSASGRAAIQRVGLAQRVPIVVGSVDGQPTQFLLDTGAFDHVLEGWFARQLAYASPVGHGAVIDHGNRKVGVDRMGKVTLALDGWGSVGTLTPLATTDSASGLQYLAIGGILSPQRLVGDNRVVIDFPRGSLSSEDTAAADARVAAMPTSLGTAERCGGSYALATTVDGHEAHLVIDTGSFMTDLLSSSHPGKALSGRSSAAREINGVGGAMSSRVVADASLKVGSLSRKLDVSIVDARGRRISCPSDGVLGMDVLVGCVLSIGRVRMDIGCN